MTVARPPMIPTVRAALFDTLTTELVGVQVLYGWDGNVASNDRVLVRGLVDAASTETPAVMGGPSEATLDEAFALTVTVEATSPGCTCQEAYERAHGTVADVVEAIRLSNNLGLADAVQRVWVASLAEDEVPGEEGWRCTATLAVQVEAFV